MYGRRLYPLEIIFFGAAPSVARVTPLLLVPVRWWSSFIHSLGIPAVLIFLRQ